MTEKNRKTDINRIALQHIIFSDASRYISKSQLEDLHSQFLRDNLEEISGIDVSFKKQSEKDSRSYYGSSNEIAHINIAWDSKSEEEVTEKKEVYQTYSFSPRITFTSSYTMSVSEMNERLDVMNCVADLLTSISQIVPDEIRLLKYTSDEYTKKVADERMRKNRIELKKFLTKNPTLRARLRIAGKSKTFYRTQISESIDPGKYEISWSPREYSSDSDRKYVIVIPENRAFLCTINRVK